MNPRCGDLAGAAQIPRGHAVWTWCRDTLRLEMATRVRSDMDRGTDPVTRSGWGGAQGKTATSAPSDRPRA